MSYVEFHSRSAFSFLQGTSHPEAMAQVAAQRGLPAIALTDTNGFYGSARMHAAAREQGIHAIVGTELLLQGGSRLPVIAKTRRGYQQLCRCLTRALLRAEKGEACLTPDDLVELSNQVTPGEDLAVLTGDTEGPLFQAWRTLGKAGVAQTIEELQKLFGSKSLWLEIQRHHLRGEEQWNQLMVDAAGATGLPLLATNGVTYATLPERKVYDIFSCLHHHTHLDRASLLLAANSQRYLKTPGQMRALFHDLPQAVDHTLQLHDQLDFSLENLGYEFPRYPVPSGENMDSFLRKLTYFGAEQRYRGITPRATPAGA